MAASAEETTSLGYLESTMENFACENNEQVKAVNNLHSRGFTGS